MDISRRSFVGGALAAGVWGGPQLAAAAAGAINCAPPRLRFGMMSDVHIGGKPDAVETTEKVLRWFASENVDAVLCAGDVAHSGLISELEKFAAVWYKVFPGGRAPDGRKVELMISTGNHDVDAWGGRWKNFTEEEMLAKRFCYKDNPEKTWQRLFGQKWEIIWRREVKGYTFIGSQWSSLKPPIEKYMKEHAQEFASSKPFFYCQHQAPRGTCHGSYSAALSGDDLGETVRALSPFPNAVAFSGHSHCAISDERTVWQGAFTSIGAGCIHEGSGGFGYANVTAAWHPSYRKKLMASLADPHPWGGDAKGGGCESPRAPPVGRVRPSARPRVRRAAAGAEGRPARFRAPRGGAGRPAVRAGRDGDGHVLPEGTRAGRRVVQGEAVHLRVLPAREDGGRQPRVRLHGGGGGRAGARPSRGAQDRRARVRVSRSVRRPAGRVPLHARGTAGRQAGPLYRHAARLLRPRGPSARCLNHDRHMRS